MREGIGSIFLYNIIIVFLLLVFALLASILSYNKAFKVNSIIISEIEKYEGYNTLSAIDIDKDLNNIGYLPTRTGTEKCAKVRNGADLIKTRPAGATDTYSYCVYYFGLERTGHNHYRYGVTSYISFDFPFLSTVFTLPIYSESDSMYNFSFGGN